MSGSQEREEAAGPSTNPRLESAAHSCVQQSSKPTHSDGGQQTHRPPSPVPSCVSMKSDQSKGDMPTFSSEPVPSGLKVQTHRPPSPVPSCVSMRSDQSKGDMPTFSSEPVPSGLKVQTHRPPSPVPSCVSMRSDQSKGDMPNFSSEPVPSGLKVQTHRPPSPVPSCVSMRSDQSKGDMPTFSSEPVPSGLKQQTHRPPSPVPSCVSMRSDQSKGDMPTFSSEPVPSGLKLQTHRPPSPVPSCVSMRSDQSKGYMPTFSSEPVPSGLKLQTHRPPSPVPSCVSMRSDQSKGDMPTFSSEPVPSGLKVQTHRPPSPVPSCVSMKSDQSKGHMPTFSSEPVPSGLKVQTHRPPSPVPSCVSMRSDQSKGHMPTFSSEPVPSGLKVQTHRPPSPVPSCVSMRSDQSKGHMPTFSSEPVPSVLKVQTHRPPSPVPSCVSMRSDQSKGHMPTFSSEPVPSGLKVRPAPEEGGAASNTSLTEEQHTSYEAWRYQQIHKSHLQKKFQCLIEGITQQGDTRLLHEIYTDLYITEGGRGEVNDEHEVRQIERASWREAARGRTIKCSDIFKHFLKEERRRKEHFLEKERCRKERFLEEERRRKEHFLEGEGKKKGTIFEPRQYKPLRTTVLTKGVAGIGKTVSVQKFILDWAEGTANQDVHFICPLPFRELNLMKEKKLSLVDLIQHFSPEIKDSRVFSSSEYRVMFIFDGLDECRIPLDFRSNPKCCDVTEPASVDVLLTNLIKGNLLPSALLWITTRPAAANHIPPECVNQVTEIRGFNDPQKEEYFKKKISDENLTSRTITHLKSSRSLYIMCHIPVFCWISATVVEKTSKESDKVKMPRTLTQMYTHFLMIQTGIKNVKYTERKETDEEVIFKLGKLAFQQLQRGNLIFYEEDLRECGIDVTEASVYSGVCTQIFREESGLHQGKVFSFVHLSIQEFLAALYVFLCFSNRQRNMPDQQQTSQLSALFRDATLHDLHKTAVDLALQSKNGHLDLFLRFLLGLSLESNQNLLKHLLPQSSSHSNSSEQTVQYVKQKIRDEDDSDRRINMFYCLNELNHHAVVEYKMSSEDLHVETLLPGEWGTKVWKTFKMSEKQLAEFDLQKYIKTPEEDQTELLSPDEVLLKVLPAVTSALLAECTLTEKSCRIVATVLQSPNSLIELDLSHNDLRDSGVQLLSKGLSSTHCKLQTLRFADCKLPEKSCGIVATVLQSPNSLIDLDLSHNDLGDSGVQLLSKGLSRPHCKLQTLRLAECKLSERSCGIVATFLQSPNSLKELDLSHNDLQNSGVQLLSKGLSSPHCKLQTLRLADCKLTEKMCETVTSVLQSPNSLLQLDVSDSDLGDSGVQLLSKGLSRPHCKLQTLRLAECKLSERSCGIVATFLQSPNSLKELDLSHNDLQNSGVQLLSKGLSSPHCKLQTLRLADCKLTEKMCETVTSVLQSPNSLLQLDVSDSDLGDSGVQLLSKGLSSSNSILQILRLAGCKLTDTSCEVVASVLQSPNSLQQLDLSDNDLGDSGVQLLSKGLSSSNCKIHTLRLSDCLISEKGCGFLAAALTSTPCYIRQLDLSYNLSYNHPRESGLKLLSARLEDPVCKLAILRCL
ncbi:NACHT, LRR and PYD domains-containing protein 12-like isoform X10 [Alosa sapidissima]|uniref:NACHT, LRR and PYD domains-containing protein 12-like isoform X10 n=1 Tax=Alosa sapidissima TaxID=34773 RepID=UPI001C09B326|nr:NACHT, LRR and PYD domains-containing protein 12-like isoform X10 [Alosa sapidissima]